jgi:hypothetical protein
MFPSQSYRRKKSKAKKVKKFLKKNSKKMKEDVEDGIEYRYKSYNANIIQSEELSVKIPANSGKYTVSSSEEINFASLGTKALKEFIREVEKEKSEILEKLKFLMKRLKNLKVCLTKREEFEQSMDVLVEVKEDLGKSKLGKSRSLKELKISGINLKEKIEGIENSFKVKTLVAKSIQATGLTLEQRDVVYRQKLVKKWKKVDSENFKTIELEQVGQKEDNSEFNSSLKMNRKFNANRNFNFSLNQSQEGRSVSSRKTLTSKRRDRTSSRAKSRKYGQRVKKSRLIQRKRRPNTPSYSQYCADSGKVHPYSMLDQLHPGFNRTSRRPNIKRTTADFYSTIEPKNQTKKFRPYRSSLRKNQFMNSNKKFSVKKSTPLKYGIRPVKNRSMVHSMSRNRVDPSL